MLSLSIFLSKLISIAAPKMSPLYMLKNITNKKNSFHKTFIVAGKFIPVYLFVIKYHYVLSAEITGQKIEFASSSLVLAFDSPSVHIKLVTK